MSSRTRSVSVPFLVLLLLVSGTGAASADDELDPTRNTPFPCDELPSVGTPARTELNIVHLANKCGLAGTDIEFQSRRAADGTIHDYAFVGSIGNGLRIFDVTDPENIRGAGRYMVQGYQNEVQVRGNRAVITFDGLAGEPSNTSTCLTQKTSSGQGVDVIRLTFNAQTARFTTSLIDCLANPPGGAHNSTFHPSGRWLAISNPSSDWAVDVMDLSRLGTSRNPHVLRLIDESRAPLAGRCPTTGVSFRCIVMRRPPAPNLGSDTDEPACRPSPAGPCPSPTSAIGLFRPHDVHFSADGNTMYVAALNSTFLVNVTSINRYLARLRSRPTTMPTVAILDNLQGEDPTDLSDPNNIELSHQSDVTKDGSILVIADEQGGGVSETGCTVDPETGVVGALHFWALRPIRSAPFTSGATPANPVRLGIWVNPNPPFVDLPGVPDEAFLPVELRGRGCTVHVFRIGQNGTASPGEVAPGFDGVSRIPQRRLSTAFYGAGVWLMDFRRSPVASGGQVEEDERTTWGNTLGWNVQLGADTWSAKEYKGHIYSGDLIRGFDAYQLTRFADPVVEIDKIGPVTATAGSRVTYSITYRNLGPAASGGATVTDILPRGLRFLSASDGGVYDSRTRTVTWDVGTVAVGETDTITLRARVGYGAEPGTQLVNRADFDGIATVSPPTAVAVTTVTP
ncbi:hypothetical protein BH20CHL6_BH20CHL6_05940 [soil metagenome]